MPINRLERFALTHRLKRLEHKRQLTTAKKVSATLDVMSMMPDADQDALNQTLNHYKAQDVALWQKILAIKSELEALS